MTLLSPLALLFGLVAAVPLILHLYQQRKRTVMLFSTNRFFTERVVRSQRRLRLRRWVLLVVRMLACLLLALALARPLLSLAGLGGAGHRDLVVILDDSLSMAADGHFDRARRFAVEAVDDLVTGDRVAIVTTSGRVFGDERTANAQLDGDLLAIRSKLEQLDVTAAAGDPRKALDTAAELFRGSEQRARQLLMITDGQQSDWRGDEPWPQPDFAVQAALVTVGPPPRDNLVADQLQLSQRSAVVGQPNLIRARLVNHDPASRKARVQVVVDEQVVSDQTIDVPGSGRTEHDVPVTFDRPGAHRVTLRLEADDAMAADNVLYDVIHTTARLPVLVVDGSPTEAGKRSGGFYLRAAMGAVSEDGASVQADLIPPQHLPHTNLDDYRAIALCNVAQLPDEQADRIVEYVRDGGGLCVFLGPNIDPGFYNGAWASLMPGRIGAIVGDEADRVNRAMHILHTELDHPILQRFTGPLRSSLAGVSIYRAHAVTPGDAWVIASMDRSLPFMLERSFGQGRVILFTTDPQPGATNLPARRVFLPLLGRTISYLAGGSGAATRHHVGRPLVLQRGGFDARNALQVTTPDGDVTWATVRWRGTEPTALLDPNQVLAAGFYSSAGPSSKTLAVNSPRSESDPPVMDVEAVTDLAGDWQVTVADLSGAATDPPSVAGLLQAGDVGRGIWDMLLWVVLVLVLVEPVIANLIGSPRQAQAQAAATARAA